jgi:hypothetical protein
MSNVQQSNSEDIKSHKRPRLNSQEPKDGAAAFQIPTLKDLKCIQEAYAKCQAVHIPNVSVTSNDTPLAWKHIAPMFESLEETDSKSWCMENFKPTTTMTPSEFLSADYNGYGSFVIQHDTTVFHDTLQHLPIATLHKHWKHEACVWWFFGVNTSNEDLSGRPEHTDSVSHDGTWHYQLSGSKTWHLRPTELLLETCPQATSTFVQVQQGDVILLNTRLWWHRTAIPPQSTPSVSYARDVYLNASPKEAPADMKNVDGLYAANTVEANTILFTENELPNVELPHSATTNDANCKVVELEDGSCALVSSRLIQAGEFFCVAEEQSDSDGAEGECSEEEEIDHDDESDNESS